MAAQLRLKRELENIKKNVQDIFSLVSFENNADGTFKLIGTLKGPGDTPYEYGVFKIQMIFPANYPFDPPSFIFLPPIPFHPNVYAGATAGKVCITILEKTQWSPTQTIESVLRSVHSLLGDLNEGSIANPEAGTLSKENKAAFRAKVLETMKANGQYHPPAVTEPVAPVAPGGGGGGGGAGAGAGAGAAAAREGSGSGGGSDSSGTQYVYSDEEQEGGIINKKKWQKYINKLNKL
jgi:ubiquitin-protein ligase